jgi:hypothetical protein
MTSNLANALTKTAVFTLPCGYVDPQGNVHKEVLMREMTGVEDDILDDGELVVNDRISKVLANCIERLGTVTDKATIEAAVTDTLKAGLPLTAQDRIAGLLFLRRVTLGDTYNYERRCPKCGDLSKNRSLDLKTIEISSVKDPKKRKVQVTLPRSGKTAVLKVLAAAGELKVSELKPNQKDLKSYAILARLESLGDRVLDNSALDVELVKALPQADRSFLIQVYQMIEGNVDTTVQVSCKAPGCGITFDFPLDLGQLFFSNQVKKPTVEDLVWM